MLADPRDSPECRVPKIGVKVEVLNIAELRSACATGEASDVAFVALGWQHTLIMRQDGSVQHRGWARTPLSTSVNLPDSESAPASSSSTGSSRHGEEVTTEVDLSEQSVMLAAGEAHSLAITASGDIYGWGSNSNGALSQHV